MKITRILATLAIAASVAATPVMAAPRGEKPAQHQAAKQDYKKGSRYKRNAPRKASVKKQKNAPDAHHHRAARGKTQKKKPVR